MNNTNESKIIISKAFDICIKNDRELKSVYVDENKYLRYLYFLTNEKIFSLNINSEKWIIKKLNQLKNK